MFFRHVVGKVQLYPYLHIVTWGLPKRYLGLLRIFNLPLDEYPNQFITQATETFNSYELQVTKKSISCLQQSIPTEEFAERGICKENKTIQNIELDQAASGESEPPRKRGRRSKKKPVISIKVKLDDDLRNLRRTTGKNFDKIISRCSRRSCMLVIEKCTDSKRDEYFLNFVNNTSYSKPYSKLLKKNRRKRESCIDTLRTTRESNKSVASEFSDENVFPALKENHNLFLEAIRGSKIVKNEEFDINLPEQTSSNGTKTYVSSFNKEDIRSENEMNETDDKRNMIKAEEKESKSRNTQLALPSHLIPYEEKPKPLRHWPVLYKLAETYMYIQIYMDYLESLRSQQEEDEEEEIKENANKYEEIVPIDIKEARKFHESLRSTESMKKQNSSDFKTSNTTISVSEEDSSEIFGSSSPHSQTLPRKNQSYETNKECKSEKIKLIDKPVESTHYSIVNEKYPFDDNISQKLYTSTAYLLIGGTANKSKNEGETDTFNRGISHTAKPDSMVNTRLLTSSMKTYESITKNDECENYSDFEKNLEGNLTKNNRNSNESRRRGMMKFYFFNIVLSLFVIVVLGVILFISFADNSTISKVVGRYIET